MIFRVYMTVIAVLLVALIASVAFGLGKIVQSQVDQAHYDDLAKKTDAAVIEAERDRSWWETHARELGNDYFELYEKDGQQSKELDRLRRNRAVLEPFFKSGRLAVVDGAR